MALQNKAAADTIQLVGSGIRKEADAGAAITPGHLIELDTAGDVVVHATAGGNAAKMFALEDDIQGKEIATAYVLANVVQYAVALRGDEINAILADAQTIVIGDFLESFGNGTLRKHVADSAGAVEFPEAVVGQAMEAVTTSGATARLRIEVI